MKLMQPTQEHTIASLKEDIFAHIRSVVKREHWNPDSIYIPSRRANHTAKATYFYICIYNGPDVKLAEDIVILVSSLCEQQTEVPMPEINCTYKMLDVFHDDFKQNNPDTQIIVMGEFIND